MVGLTMDYLEITGLDLEPKNLLSSYKEQLPSLPDLIMVCKISRAKSITILLTSTRASKGLPVRI